MKREGLAVSPYAKAGVVDFSRIELNALRAVSDLELIESGVPGPTLGFLASV